MAPERPWFAHYRHLVFDLGANGVLSITINRPERLNATNDALHGELSRVWKDLSDDELTKVAVVTGAGRAFCAGGDLDMVEQQIGNFATIEKRHREAADIVYNMINCRKVIVSAINGAAVGAGLAVALLADIAIISEDAKIADGHLRLGVGAGDHATIIWPLLCGMAKSKYYLLTGASITGREAERIGLASMSVPAGEVLSRAMEIAAGLASGPQGALRATKHNLNNWLRLAGPTFDASLAMEMLDFFGPDVLEGVTAFREKRKPRFSP